MAVYDKPLAKLIEDINYLNKEIYKAGCNWVAEDVIITDWLSFYAQDMDEEACPVVIAISMCDADANYRNVPVYLYLKADGKKGASCDRRKYAPQLQGKDINKICSYGWKIIDDIVAIQEVMVGNISVCFPSCRKITRGDLKGVVRDPNNPDNLKFDFGCTDDFVRELDKAMDVPINKSRRALDVYSSLERA